ncbi:MAG: alpha/beta hydrolase-fold protein [Candidatus Bathyarchaeia archaeon]
MKEGSPISASLEHVVYYPPRKAEKYATVVALHGRGTDENDLIPLVHSLGLTDALLISPRAPAPFEFGGGFAWYDVGQEGVPNAQSFGASLDLLRRFMDEIRAGYPVDRHRVILLGFSQGTVMAYSVALLDPASFLGVAALSGYIPQRSSLPLALEDLRGFSVFVSHGAYDQIIPVRLARESAEVLKKAGARVEYREYPMGHEVSQETVRDLSAWIKNLLK